MILRLENEIELKSWAVEFLSTKHYRKILSGAAGTGKSYVALFHIIKHALDYKGAVMHGLSGANATQTYKNITEPLCRLLDNLGLGFTYQYRAALKRVQFDNGSYIDMYSGDNYEKAGRGPSPSLVWIDELTAIPEKEIEKHLAQADARTRQQGGYPRHVIITTNPDLVTHSFYKKYIIDPPADTWVKNLTFDEGYLADDQEYRKSLMSLPPAQRKMLFEGEWAYLEGQVFQLDQSKVMTDIKPDPNSQYHLAFDYGFDPDPMAYLLIENRGSLLIVREELEFTKVPISEHYKLLDPWFEKYKITAFTGETATGSAEVRNMLRKKYKISRKGTVKDRRQGWTRLIDVFHRQQILIDNCPLLWESLTSLTWLNNKMDITPGNDHLADTLRYYIMSRLYYRQLDKYLKEGDQ